ncbi:Multidrug export protein mepA [Slackia heliotrinireducens]|uniref:Putative efflux protein, MATE family n=1 Tax=Slackia heliotrinireducens (strain ATCC 29202 / DSM 20476 / NCTC 11029 / RHS 1) TaxID=471855 RepID=C7N7I6_SLAHD|nr:MATE family efflux transporter [Slackia heliotrinireducens]ACV22871.1 putative efflux protein, MATE family [Slackia heliotrinireducens DSM 20476]VEH01634.1 Multidrug export protein mepA [Slackia heliotrinireducens]
MYQGSAAKVFARYAIPQMIGLLFNSVYIIVDGVFIGNRLGSMALAATGVAVPVVELLIALSMAVTAGAGVVVSTRIAKREHEQAVRAFHTCLVLQGIIGLSVVILGNLFIHPLAKLLGATPDIQAMTVTYLRYVLSFAPFLLFGYLLGGLARNDGKPKLAMVALSAGSLSNILLDYVFMYPLNMGIAGAALATGIGPIVSMAILLPHFFAGKGVLRFQKTALSGNDARSFLRLGLPSFVMEFSIGMVTFLMNFGIVRYGFGENGLAAYLIIGYLMLIVFTLFLGMAEGLQPAFSYLHAAGDHTKLKALLRFAACVFTAVGVVSYVLVLFFSIRFYSIFTPEAHEVAVMAAQKSTWYFCGLAFAGINILSISYYQATAQTGNALLISSLRGFVLPALLILILPAACGPELLWICHSTAEIMTTLVCLACATHLLRR